MTNDNNNRGGSAPKRPASAMDDSSPAHSVPNPAGRNYVLPMRRSGRRRSNGNLNRPPGVFSYGQLVQQPGGHFTLQPNQNPTVAPIANQNAIYPSMGGIRPNQNPTVAPIANQNAMVPPMEANRHNSTPQRTTPSSQDQKSLTDQVATCANTEQGIRGPVGPHDYQFHMDYADQPLNVLNHEQGEYWSFTTTPDQVDDVLGATEGILRRINRDLVTVFVIEHDSVLKNGPSRTPDVPGNHQPITHQSNPPSFGPKGFASSHAPEPVICGGCGEEGHYLNDCAVPNEVYGDIKGCPFCNTKEHSVDDCGVWPRRHQDPYENEWMTDLMIKKRVNMPPIRSELFNVGIWFVRYYSNPGRDVADGFGLPWSREHVKSLQQRDEAPWLSFDYTSPETSQLLMGQDPFYMADNYDAIKELRWTYSQAREVWNVENQHNRPRDAIKTSLVVEHPIEFADGDVLFQHLEEQVQNAREEARTDTNQDGGGQNQSSQLDPSKKSNTDTSSEDVEMDTRVDDVDLSEAIPKKLAEKQPEKSNTGKPSNDDVDLSKSIPEKITGKKSSKDDDDDDDDEISYSDEEN